MKLLYEERVIIKVPNSLWDKLDDDGLEDLTDAVERVMCDLPDLIRNEVKEYVDEESAKALYFDVE